MRGKRSTPSGGASCGTPRRSSSTARCRAPSASASSRPTRRRSTPSRRRRATASPRSGSSSHAWRTRRRNDARGCAPRGRIRADVDTIGGFVSYTLFLRALPDALAALELRWEAAEEIYGMMADFAIEPSESATATRKALAAQLNGLGDLLANHQGSYDEKLNHWSDRIAEAMSALRRAAAEERLELEAPLSSTRDAAARCLRAPRPRGRDRPPPDQEAATLEGHQATLKLGDAVRRGQVARGVVRIATEMALRGGRPHQGRRVGRDAGERPRAGRDRGTRGTRSRRPSAGCRRTASCPSCARGSSGEARAAARHRPAQPAPPAAAL